MSDSFDLTEWRRRSSGTGVGTVAGSPIGLRVTLNDDRACWGDTLDAEPAHVEAAFESSFSDFGLALKHDSLRLFGIGGTNIDLIVTGLSVGAGLVAAEFLKEVGKDLWKALKSLLHDAECKKTDHGLGGDTIHLTLVIDNRNVSTKISLPSTCKGITTAELLRKFCENAAADLYLKELARRNAPLLDRLLAYCKDKWRND